VGRLKDVLHCHIIWPSPEPKKVDVTVPVFWAPCVPKTPSRWMRSRHEPGQVYVDVLTKEEAFPQKPSVQALSQLSFCCEEDTERPLASAAWSVDSRSVVVAVRGDRQLAALYFTQPPPSLEAQLFPVPVPALPVPGAPPRLHPL
jgi:hypothetical protein